MDTDDSELIPELAQWNNGEGISLRDWITGLGRFDHALGYSSVFWPQFTEFDGCIFRVLPNPVNYAAWMKSLKGNRPKVEAMMNHVHLVDLFSKAEYQPNKSLLICLGQTLKEMWSCKLKMEFPKQFFEVELSTEGDDMAKYELTFYQLT